MADNGEYEQQRRSARTPSPHWILEEDDEETTDEEDLLFTYSTDREGGSISRILSKPSQQLIDLESLSDEESLRLIVDTSDDDDDDDENSQQQRPPAQQMLMIPSLADNTNNSEHDNSVLEEIYATQRKSESPRRKSPASSSHSFANKFNFQQATLSPVNMRRVASTPTKFQSFKPPKSPSPPSSGSPVRRSRAASSIKTTISNAYSLRRQSSLPARETLWDNHHRDDDMSSESSLDDDMAQLAQELAIPKSNRPIKIFRSVTVRSPSSSKGGRPPSPSSFRVATPPSVPTTPKNMSDGSCKSNNEPDSIRRVDTAMTDGSDDEELGSLVGSARSSPQRRATPALQSVGEVVDVTDVESDSSREHLWKRRKVQYVIYLSTFACFGTIIRVFIGRFFGLDCEFQNNVNDWMSPISRHVCVTASGLTEQRGGALFVDLPCNMLGSFIMGLLTVLKPNTWPAIPWLKSDHPLQKHEILHIAIKTGLCGSLTTFASWNAQMVVMLDGSRTVLGPQIVEALYGYVLGIMTAIASFSFGTHVSAWLNNWRRNPVGEDNPSPPPIIVFPKLGGTKCGQLFKSLFMGVRMPFMLLGCLMASFLVADFAFNSPFYRTMWLQVLFTPAGAVLRWSLAARLNGTSLRRGWDWLPLGTITANLFGSFVSVLLLAVEFRYYGTSTEWSRTIITAARVGFAGSLSTVSTFVMELVRLSKQFPHHAKPYYYCALTISSAMILSLIVYIPIVRL